MDSLEAFYYLIITFGIFIAFSLVITIFGSIFLYYIAKNRTQDVKLSILEISLISYAIGLSLFISFAYIFDIFQIFYFYTAYLFYIVCDLIFIFFLKKKGELIKLFIELKNFIKNHKKPLVYTAIIFSALIFLIFFKFWNKIGFNSALPSRDTYSWTAATLYLLKHGHMSNEWFGSEYPPGFMFLNAGSLLIFPNYTIAYYYMKFGFIPYLIVFLICLYSICKIIFQNNNHIIFFSLALIFSFSYFLKRTISFLPPIVCEILFFTIFLIVYKKLPTYIIGFILPALYLIHNITALFFYVIFICFYIIKLIVIIKKKEKIILFIKDISLLIILTMILLIPFLLHAYFCLNTTFFDLIGYYFGLINLNCIIDNRSIEKFPLLLSVINIQQVNLFSPGIERTHEFFLKETIYLFSIFAIIPLFIRNKQKDQEFKDLLILLKLCFLFVIIIFLGPYFLSIDSIQNNHWYDKYSYRIVENFAGAILILIGIGWNWIVEKITIIWQKLRFKFKNINEILNKHRLLKIIVNLKTLILIGTILIPFFWTYNTKYYYYYMYDDQFIENVLYINEKVPQGSHLAIPDFDTDDDRLTKNNYVRLLFDYKNNYYNISINWTYNDFYLFCVDKNIDYILFAKKDWNNSFVEEFEHHDDIFVSKYQPEEKDSIYGVYKFDN